MEFIEQLSLFNGFTAIFVVIDRHSKESALIPATDNATATCAADTSVTYVFAKRGIPLHVFRSSANTMLEPYLRIYCNYEQDNW